MSIQVKPFGKLPSGEDTRLYTLTNAGGASVSISNYGGTLVAIRVPDRDGKLTDVLLGAKEAKDYLAGSGYLGALIGRVGNRIGKGLARLNGEVLHLAQNSNGQHLHGGNIGFDKKIWDATPDEANNRLVLKCVSPDGEENYPGTLNVTVTYGWSDDNALSIHYEATSDKDTLVNLTNHAYFNLDGESTGDVGAHAIQIHADRLTVVDADAIPTGELRDVTGTPFDLRQPKCIADGLSRENDDEQMRFGSGYDHNFALNGAGYREAALVYSAKTGIQMTVSTDQPGIQFYTGNFLDGSFPGKRGAYQKRSGLCLETQHFPDSMNHDEFKPCVLKAGEKYDTTTTYRFGVA